MSLSLFYSMSFTALNTGCPGANIYVSTCYERQRYASQIWFEGVLGILNSGHLTYNPWIWLKVTYMASTASNRKSAKNQQNSGFLMIHSTFLRPGQVILVLGLMKTLSSPSFFDKKRLSRSSRPLWLLWLLRSLRLLRFLMPGKSLSVSSF